MYKRTSLFILLIFLTGFLYAQKSINIKLASSREKSTYTEKVQASSKGLTFKESFSSIDLVEKETKGGLFRQLTSQGMSKTYDAGKPDLPVVTKLIEIPNNSKAIVKIVSYDEQIIELKDYAIFKKIIPAQPSVVKSKNPKDEKFHKNQKIYKKNSFFKKDLVKFVDKGFLRNKHLGYIEISPFRYNPVTNTLKVLNNIEIEVNFITDARKSVNTKTLQSPYFKNVTNTINQIEEPKKLINGPVKYVIVSDPMFEAILQPFIEWKTMKGFNVIAAYTNDPGVGNTTTSIKAYLQDLYDNPANGISPTFVLLVGDVAQIPSFSGTTGSHVTDLYYCEYTGDKLPEVFYGRFSAESIAELQPQIDKTLKVEKYLMPNPSYLDKVVLVAGVDGTYGPTHANGAVNYANSYYTNATNGVTSYYYLYNDDSGVMSSNNPGASESIRNYISRGISFSNYTAHCSSDGWADPGFNISNIDGLTNADMYPLLIGNCCQSNKFNVNDCFGEEVLKAENKGAVGYIGGSADTYWDEDYYWGVGFAGSITANPVYENSGLGAFDRFFHLNGEAKQDWYITQGQINVAGNLAVETSASSLKSYYWEIYHLMGDPSLTPYVSVPLTLASSYYSSVVIGTNSLTVTTEEDAYVAVSFEGELLDVKLADVSGIVNLTFDALTTEGSLDIVITKQNKQPKIDKILIISGTTPYVLLDTFLIDDNLENANGEVDNGESVYFDIRLKNFAKGYDAYAVNAILSSADTNVVITDSTENFGTILKLANSLVNKAFAIDFKNKFTNQQPVEFNISIIGKDSGGNNYSWNSKLEVTVNAPEILIGDILFDDSNTGNNDSIMDAGETGDILLIISNTGHNTISNLSGDISILGDGANYLTLNSSSSGSFGLGAQQTDTLRYDVTASLATPMGKNLFFLFDIEDTGFGYYSVSENKELFVGGVSEVLISAGDTINTNSADFYDTGGKNNSYSNSEDYIITFMPADPNAKLIVDFKSFNVEQNLEIGCYDYMSIYDGDTISANLIGEFCNSNIPGKIIATNISGSLTFKFYSDGSETRSGWEAEIREYVPHNFQLTVNNSEGQLEVAAVEFDNEKDTTGINGIVLFSNISEGIDLPLKVSATGHNDFITSIDLFDNITETITLEKVKYNIIIYIYDENLRLTDSTIINFLGENNSSDITGKHSFNNIEYCLNEKIVVIKESYFDYIDTIDIISNKSIKIVLEKFKGNATFKVLDSEDNPMDNVQIRFDSGEKYTNREGYAIFEKIIPSKSMEYILTKPGYYDFSKSVNFDYKDTTITINMSIVTEDINIYPNPSNGLFNLEIKTSEHNQYYIEIYDVIGSKIYSKKVNGLIYEIEPIDISNSSKGIYFLVIRSKEGVILSRKLVVN